MSSEAQIAIACLVVVPPLVWRLIGSPMFAFKAFANAKGPVDHIAQDPGKGGIAISKARRELHLMSCSPARALFTGRGAMKTYRFEDVREWSINDIQAGQIFYGGGGLSQGVAAASANNAARRAAKNASGLFVSVRDIERAEWQIRMDRKRQKQWFEILAQLINDE